MSHNVPTASGTAMLRGLPNGRQIIFPHSSHILPSAANVDCVVVILRAFLTDPRAPLDTSCVEAVPAPSYSTELPEWVTEIGRESTENGSARHFQDAVRPRAAVGEAR